MLTFRAGFENLNVLLSLRLGDFSKSAFLGLIYEKAVKLKNTGNQSAGEVCYHVFHLKNNLLEFLLYWVPFALDQIYGRRLFRKSWKISDGFLFQVKQQTVQKQFH